MQIVSLQTNPARRDLDPATVDSLRNAWGGGEITWLAPDLAAEFAVASVPANAAEVAEALRARGLDVNVLPARGRRKRLLVADMDSTMIDQECIDELAAEAGVGPRVAEITRRAMNGELDFEGALRERVSLLEGLSETVIEHVLRDRITLAAGARALVATMKAHGAHTLLVSGGFTHFSASVAQKIGFDEHRANRLVVEGGKLAGRVHEPILGRDAKVAALDEVARAKGLSPADALAAGDGANDLGMLLRAGMGVAVHAKPSVAAAAPLRIDHGDLTSLLYLQGYAEDEIVTS
ncbi:MAG: phosphoserine phosphatase SerB [Alphaproteobacteria bacterium]|nr:MAG: phosphoserine phosphatase SerB [Alphaproteobacteria bacterium]